MIQQYLKRTKRLFLTLLLLWTVSFASASINHKATIAFVTTKTTRDLSTKKRRNDFASFSVVSDQQEEGVKAEKKSKEESLLPNNEGTTTAVSSVKKKEKSARLDLPWADFHEWALRDNIPKYTRILPGVTPKTYALWRTMLQDVPELSGYPISFLQEKCTQKSNATSSDSSKQEIPDVLPYLDNFYFEPSGGLSGQVYGVPGLKDGTVIETSPVGQVEVTIPLGYVLTEDAGIAYELGKPLAEVDDEGISRKAGKAAGTLSRSASQGMVAAMSNSRKGSGFTEEDPNAMLVRLGASTGLLLAGATAVNMLSHHMTVNVFWV